jgi:hypothetical protein
MSRYRSPAHEITNAMRYGGKGEDKHHVAGHVAELLKKIID